MRLLSALWLFSLLAAFSGAYPGALITTQQSFVSELTQTITPKLENALLHAQIPDYSEMVHVFLMGDYNFTISDIIITSVQFNNDQILIDNNIGLALSIVDGSGTLTMNWNWKHTDGIIHYSDGGSADVSFSKLSLSVVLAIGVTNERLTISANPTVTIGKLDITVHSGLIGWVYDIVLDILNSSLKKSIESKFDDTIRTLFDDTVTGKLQAMPILIPLGPGSQIDFDIGIPSAPTFASPTMTFGINGGFVLDGETPGQSTIAMPNSVNSEMLNFLLSEYVFQTAANAVFGSQLLANITVDSQTFPQLDPFLNTTFWKDIIPGLYKYYPDQPLTLELGLNSVPFINITAATGLQAQTDWRIDFIVGEDVLALILGAQFETEIELSVFEANGTNYITAHFDQLSLKFSVEHSNVGRVNVLLINTVITTIFDTVIIPMLNSIFGNGIPLPGFNGFQLVGVQFSFYDGYVALSSSVNV